MNKVHKECIARAQIDNLVKIYNGELKFQTVYVPGGPTRRRIIIEHDVED